MQIWIGASDATFDEEFLCAIEIYRRPSVHELRRWVELKVNILCLISQKLNVCYKKLTP